MNLQKNFLLLVTLSLVYSSCQPFHEPTAPKDIYPDMELLLEEQVPLLEGKILTKKVSLGSRVEVDTFQMDSTKWKHELSFFKDINPNLPSYVGVFEIVYTEFLTSLRAKEGEKVAIKSLTISKKKGKRSIRATLHHEVSIYTHHQDINVLFEEGVIHSYRVDGYQKILLKDTIKFSIASKIL